MANNCENCKYVVYDYIWDEESGEEYPFNFCEIRHSDYFDDANAECPFFEKYKARPYVEKDTECDKCEHVRSCEESGAVLETTNYLDTRRHFVRGINVWCKKRMGDLGDKKISEVLVMIDEYSGMSSISEFLHNMLERHGDIAICEVL